MRVPAVIKSVIKQLQLKGGGLACRPPRTTVEALLMDKLRNVLACIQPALPSSKGAGQAQYLMHSPTEIDSCQYSVNIKGICLSNCATVNCSCKELVTSTGVSAYL